MENKLKVSILRQKSKEVVTNLSMSNLVRNVEEQAGDPGRYAKGDRLLESKRLLVNVVATYVDVSEREKERYLR